MQRLDPSRFPGNPALVEQLHSQVLADVDKLELQLRRQLDDKDSGQVRSGDTPNGARGLRGFRRGLLSPSQQKQKKKATPHL